VFPTSTKGQLLILEDINVTRSDGSYRVVARSYDGNPWEETPEVDFPAVNLICNSSGVCVVGSPGTFQVRELVVPEQLINTSTMVLVARLHQQATFGASRTELQRVASVYGTDFGRWILDQMRLPPTYSRVYLRERTNPRPWIISQPFIGGYPAPIKRGPNNQPCDLDSRWHRYAFEWRDIGKTLVVRNDDVPGRFSLRVDGAIRGEVDLFPISDTFPAQMRICRLRERVGGIVVLSNDTSESCGVNWQNPAISITSTTYIQTFDAAEATLVPVVGNPDAVVLKTRSVPCLNLTDSDANSFIRQGNQTWRFDLRMRYVLNTPESPNSVGASSTSTCPVVPKTFLTADKCVRRAACGSGFQFRSASVVLNDTTIRSWYTDSGKYVYYMTGLRLEDTFAVSPCLSGTSRWQRMGGVHAQLRRSSMQTQKRPSPVF
jgi:hypothetical protein